MRIIHTADWHIGQTFYGYDRREEHIHFFEWLCEIIEEKCIDILMVSGDIFDGPNPSAESQKLYYSFLRNVTVINPKLQIIIIAGNHDSAARLESPNPLLESMHITVRGGVDRVNGEIDYDRLIVPIYSYEKSLFFNEGNCNDIVAYCLAVPYLRQGDYPLAESYSEGVKSLYDTLFERVKDKGKPVFAMGHLQATGSEISENDRSERTVIGGMDGISPDSFDSKIIYTALGHLHRAQRVSKRENVRYSGTPIPMSFAEKSNTNSVVYIDYENGNLNIEKLEVPILTRMISIPQKPLIMDDVIEELSKLEDGEVNEKSPYLEVKLLMNGIDTSHKYKIEEALNGKAVRLAKITPTYPQVKKSSIAVRDYEELQKIGPLDVALDYYKKKFNGDDMPKVMKEYLIKVIEEAKQ